MFILPINKDNPVRKIPWVVLALIAANTTILALTYGLYTPRTLFLQYGFVPAHPHLRTMLTSMFLHSGFWHLAGNMFFLWMFGNQVENMFGRWLFSLTYIACGLGAAGVHYLLNAGSAIPCVGASGAISGIVGVYFVLFPKARFDLEIYFGWWHLKTIPTRTQGAVGAWVAEQFLLGLLTQITHATAIAFWAHVGGFAAGVVAGLVFKLAVPEKSRRALQRAKPWYMQDRFNRDDSSITQLKL